nr:tetratricopeptide repeat protein [Lysobacter penaei]
MDSIYRPALARLLPVAAACAFAFQTVPAMAFDAPREAAATVPAADSDDPVLRALEPLMEGEFALQAGRLDEAADAYLRAARETGDAGLAERATRIGLLTQDDARTEASLALWGALGGAEEDMLAAEAALSLRQGHDRRARRQLEALIGMPEPGGWRQAFGVLATGGHDPGQSVDVLRYLVRRDRIPAQLEAWMAFGGLALRLDAPDLVDDIVDKVIEHFPGEPRVALLRAGQLREAGREDEAREALGAIEPRALTDPSMRQSVAHEYDRLGDLDLAEQTLAQGPQDDQTYALRASLLARDEDTEGLTALYRELGRDAASPDPQRRLLLGQIAEFLERYDEALAWYEGVPGGPQRWQARLRGANVLHELGRTPAAFDALADVQADPTAPDDARRDAFLLESVLHQEDDDPRAEMEAFARGLSMFPDEPEILYARALAWERRDDIVRAEADFRRILVIEPESVAALNALGYTLADRTDRYQEALELINRARAAQPDNAAIIDSYGWVLYRLGRHREALVELRRALALQEDAEIASHLAEVLWAMGRREEALEVFEQARVIDPDNRALRRALEGLGLPVEPAAPAAPDGDDADEGVQE